MVWIGEEAGVDSECFGMQRALSHTTQQISVSGWREGSSSHLAVRTQDRFKLTLLRFLKLRQHIAEECFEALRHGHRL